MAKPELACLGGRAHFAGPHPVAWPNYDVDTVQQIADMVARGDVYYEGTHPIIDELTERFCSLTDMPLGLAVNSASTGLLLAYLALRFGPGDEVICSPLSYFVTATALLAVGATPVFADITPDTGNIDPDAIAARLTSRTKGIVVTHLWGHPADMGPIMALAGRHGLAVVEDASHAHGATLGGRPVGSFGDVSVFSLGTQKQVSGGAAGMALARNRAVFERMMIMGHHPSLLRDQITDPELRPFVQTALGLNARPGLIAAALALSHLRRLPDLLDIRKHNFDKLSQLLSTRTELHPIATRSGATRGGWFGFKMLAQPALTDRVELDRFVEAVRAEGVKMRREGVVPIHLTGTFSSSARPPVGPWASGSSTPWKPRPDDCPQAVAMHAKLLTLAAKYFHAEASDLAASYAGGICKVLDGLNALEEKVQTVP